jgi:hypothetical protein
MVANVVSQLHVQSILNHVQTLQHEIRITCLHDLSHLEDCMTLPANSFSDVKLFVSTAELNESVLSLEAFIYCKPCR